MRHGLQASAASSVQTIRVGLESHFLEQSQIIVHANVLEVGTWVSGHFHVSGILSTNNNFVAVPNNSAFVRISQTFSSLTHAQQEAGLHIGSIPALLYNGSWGLYLAADNLEHAHQLAASLGGVAISSGNNRVSVSANGQIVLISDNGSVNLQVRDIQGITSLGVRRYRGVIELARFRGQNITAVNVLNLEDYLLSVVPSEMPAGWHMEALKAQAVAARTYAAFRLGSLAERGYDLCDTVFSQVYLGVSNEHQNTTYAVNATRGLMMFHNNQLIEAVYFSSSGGFTENSENVWIEARPYLRSVADIYDTTGLQWTRSLSLTQLTQLLSTHNINIGNASGVQLTTTANGRVQEVMITGTNGNHTVRSEAIRSFFTPSLESRNFSIQGGTAAGSVVLPGTNATTSSAGRLAHVRTNSGTFNVEPSGLQIVTATGNAVLGTGNIVVASRDGNFALQTTSGQVAAPGQTAQMISSTGYNIIFVGRGWGHGVGMSQHGANGMAAAGYNFRQILHHYYSGVDIR